LSIEVLYYLTIIAVAVTAFLSSYIDPTDNAVIKETNHRFKKY